MTLTLNLSPELENALSTEASRLSLSLPEYVLHLLSERQTLNTPPQTGEELVAYWQREGLIGSRLDITDSQAYSRQLRHDTETRERHE
jgi:hypothetical protein